MFFFPQAAVREFQVIRSGANAEIGRTNGGFVNVVTKSGSNEVHGEGFYYDREKVLTSPDAFGRRLNNQQSQAGGSVGGPLSQDRAFFFVAPEFQAQQSPSTGPYTGSTDAPVSQLMIDSVNKALLAYGIAAYVSTLLIMLAGVPFWIAFVLAVAASGVAGIVLAVFAVRLRVGFRRSTS